MFSTYSAHLGHKKKNSIIIDTVLDIELNKENEMKHMNRSHTVNGYYWHIAVVWMYIKMFLEEKW